MKKTLLSLAFLSLGVMTQAQVKIGDNHNTINANSILELESTDKGILFPRVALVATNDDAPLNAHVQGMIVYNTATAGTGATAVRPGVYYNTGLAWEKVNAAASTIPGAPIGSVVTMAANTVPTGYLYCDGSSVSRTTYADLFAVIGTTYGSADANSFNLPDYRGQFHRGQDDTRGLDPDAGSRTGGDAVGSTQSGQVQSHTHDTYYNATAGGASNPAYRMKYTNADATQSGGIIRSQSTGGNETRPTNIAVKYCIKFEETEYTGATGATGADGDDGNSMLNGTSDPTTEGNDGDFFYNTSTNTIFGPKASGTWPAGVQLNNTVPVGTVITKASSNAPTGYLYCNGQAVSRTTYADLFADIGTSYGAGNGTTTFNVPDYRGQFLRGQDDAATVDPDAGARTDRGDGTTGDNVGTQQSDEINLHNHGSGTHNNYTSVNGGGTFTAGNKGLHAGVSGGTGQILTTSTGGNETRPTNIAVRYYIKF